MPGSRMASVRRDTGGGVDSVIAWVESPLQLIGAAEWASAHDRSVPIAGRLTPQMPETADELLRRGAPFGRCEPYLGIPWTDLARHKHWLVGDGFSGQFRLAVTLLRPRRITFLDDGANTLALADSLVGRREFERPGVSETGMTARMSPFALDAVRRRAVAGGVSVFTAFALGPERLEALDDLGVSVRSHRFDWTRAHPGASRFDERRIVLGSALPVDGRIDRDAYLDWVRAASRGGSSAYLPHRREDPALLDAVRRTGIRVVETNLPVELALAGTTGDLEIVTLPSSTQSTLPLVLEGTGSVIRSLPLGSPVSRADRTA